MNALARAPVVSCMGTRDMMRSTMPTSAASVTDNVHREHLVYVMRHPY